MNHTTRLIGLVVSLTLALTLIGLGMVLLHGEAPAVARETAALHAVVIALGQEPASLYVYGDDYSLAAATVRDALMDGPFTHVDFAYQTTLLTHIPGWENGDVALFPTLVTTGSQVVADDGSVVTLAANLLIRPSGCRTHSCAILFDGTPVLMDAMVVTSTLRGDIHWSDGMTLTVQDALFGQQIACDPATPADKTVCDRTVAYMAATADATVWTSLPGYWNQRAGLIFWTPLPHHILGGLTALDILNSDYGRAPLGWGPFRITEWITGSHITLERNPYYWRLGYPKLDQVTFRFMSNSAEIYDAMERGEIHLASQTTLVASDYITDMLTPPVTSTVELLWSPNNVWEHTDFGMLPADSRYIFFADPQVRRAVAYALDRQRIINEAWHGLGTPLNTYLPDTHPLYPPTLTTYPYSPTLAADLLTAAGWVDTNANGIRDNGGREFVITYSTTTAPQRIQAGYVLSENLAAVGIQVNLNFQPASLFFTPSLTGTVFGRKFDLANFAWIYTEPNCELYESWQVPTVTNGWTGQNDTGYSNPAYDAACEQALGAWPDTPEYVQGHQTAMHLLAEDVPMLPIFTRNKMAVASTAFFVGPRLDPIEATETWNIWEWSLGTEDTVVVGLVTDAPTVLDKSFNELSYQGLLRAETELGIVSRVYTSASSADYGPNLEQCVQDGADLCLGVGFGLADAISTTAVLHPDVRFALLDAPWETTLPNLRGLTFSEDQAGYLAGTLAALMSSSRTIGAVGGAEIPPVQRFVDGYRNGARCAAPATTVVITYTNTFVDPALGARAAQDLIAQNADVIFGVGGTTGNGAILTATQSGMWAIGVDTDQYTTVFEGGGVAGSDRLLSSAMKRLDNAVFDTIGDIVSGTFTSGTVLYTVAEGGVSLAPFHETDPLIPQSVRSRLSGVAQGLREGWLDVYGPCVATVGVAADLSDGASDIGWQQVNAVQLAISQTNALGGLNLGGPTYTLHMTVADDGCNATRAVTAANTLLDAGAVAVVGHTCSSASLAAQPLYAAAGVPMVSPSATRPNVTQQGYNTTFRVISHDASASRFLATYFRQWMGYTRSVIIHEPGTEWLRDVYSDTFTALGGVITSDWTVTNVGDFPAILNTIQAEAPDVIFVAGYSAAEPGQLSKTAYDMGMGDIPIAWDSLNEVPMWLYAYLGWAGNAAAEGDFIAMHQRPFWAMPGWNAFVANYQAAAFTHGPATPDPITAFAYDAAGLLLDALHRADSPAPADMRSMLGATGSYYGVVGMYQGFDGYGDVLPQWTWIQRFRNGEWTPAYTMPELGAELHVCAGHCDFDSIQAAVDSAGPGDVIKVAGGTYSDLHGKAAPVGYYGPSVITQVVYIDKAITLRGGYSTADWDMPAPDVNPTIMDAQGGGRALVIVGEATVEGFHLTGGDALNLRGSDRAGGTTDAGGGVFITGAPPTLNHCQIYGNTAHQGGGVYVDRTVAFLYDNTIYANTANWGGGIALWESDATISGNTITGNNAIQAGASGPEDVWPSSGGGLDVYGNPQITGNTITGNSTDRQGGGLALYSHANATIHQNTISANTAITGGGLYLSENEAQITENTISDNTASQYGGGMSLWDSNAWIQSNDIFSNTAQGSGGGVHSYSTHHGFEEFGGPALFGNHIRNNTAYGGGGVFLEFSFATLIGNTFEGNEATGGGAGVAGGGMSLLLSDAIVDRNTFTGNRARQGGALGFQGGNARLYNNFIFENQATERGSALYTFGASPYFAHNTIARNTGGDGSAIYSTYWEPFDQSWDMVNTIIYDQAIGISAHGAITITLDHVLWHNTPVTVTTDGVAAIFAQAQLSGDPLFVYPDTGDYHIQAASPARDAGLEMPDVLEDIDWQMRPMGLGYDIGADEAPGVYLAVQTESSARVLLPGQTLTYSVAITNDGALTATGTLLKFTLDAWQRAAAVTPGGLCLPTGDWGETFTCPLGDLPPGAAWRFEVTAQVAPTVPPAQAMWSWADGLADATMLRWAGVRTISRARLVYPISIEPQSLDVNREAANMNTLTLLAQLMEAPYRYDAHGVLIPAGATGTTVSPDGLVYTVTLRADALWSDGVPVTAQHYADSVIRMLDPATGAEYAYVLYPIQGAQEFNTGVITDAASVGVTALDAHTLRFTLHSPAAFFPTVLATSAMYPVRLDVLNTSPFIGNGPYVLTEWVSGKWFILDKNPRYHDAAQVLTSRLLLPIIPIEEQVAAYEAGLLDVSEIPAADMGSVLNDPILNNELRSVPWPGVYYLGLNNVLTPTNDLAVRQALASAVDRDALLTTLNTPWREAATSVIPPGMAGYQNGAVGYGYNPAQAQAYLAAAGYPGGAGFPGVELWATEGARPLAEAVAAGWRSVLNISVTVAYQENYNALRACGAAPGECTYHAYRLGWIMDYPDPSNILNEVFHPNSTYQYTGWDNARFRQLMALQLNELDPAQRTVYLQEADRILVQDEAAIIPLYFYDRVFLIKPDIVYEYSTIGGPRLMTWRMSGTAVPCYVRVSSLPGITYSDLQTAVDAAQAGDTLKVAGTCTGVHTRPRRDLTASGVVTQMVYIAKDLTLQGGYTTTNWLHPNPQANPTTLDALGQGRVLYVTGGVAVTVDGFHITGGAAGQGGGAYVITATVLFRNNTVFDNVSEGGGGGAYFCHSPSTLRDNLFMLNRGGWGGGLYLYESAALVAHNTFDNNASANSSGGIRVYLSDATLDGNTLIHNTAVGYGGGLSVFQSNATLNGNLVRFNTAAYGGGVELNRTGGTWTNNVVADNHADLAGSGIYAHGATTHLLHTTLARNHGGGNVGVYVTQFTPGDIASALVMTNTILVDHAVGISVTAGNELSANTVLWYGTPLPVAQSPVAVVTVLNDWVADPRFAADGYHLRIGSAALDAGAPTAVARDVDGDPRPYGGGFDVGADEAPYVSVNPQAGATLVYTATEGTTTTLTIPPAAVSETITIVFTQLAGEEAETPPELVGGEIGFELDAYTGETPVATGFVFGTPVTVTIVYSDADIAGMDESTLRLYRYVCAEPGTLQCTWELIGTRTGEGQMLDTENNVLTAWLVGFSRFRGMGGSFQPAWELAKTYAGNRVAGTAITYTLTVTNTGNGDATAVTLEDSLPEYLTWSTGGTFESGMVRWTFEAITASGGTGVGQFSAILPCTASLAIVNDDYRVTGNAQGVTSTVGPPVSLAVASPTIAVNVTVTPTAPVAGDTVMFTATAVTNGGPLAYQWSVGGNGLTVTQTYPMTGTYSVAFTATDACGYYGVKTVNVGVGMKGYFIYMPLVMR